MLAKYRVTSFCAPPTIYRYMIKEDMASYDLSALKWGTVAGEPLNPEVFYRFKEFTGVELREAFGQTENSPLALTPKWMAPKPGSIGKPSPHYHIRLLDAEGRDVEPGEEGEICVDISQRRPAGLFVAIIRMRSARGKHSPGAFTARATWPGAMKRATIGSLAGRTM